MNSSLILLLYDYHLRLPGGCEEVPGAGDATGVGVRAAGAASSSSSAGGKMMSVGGVPITTPVTGPGVVRGTGVTVGVTGAAVGIGAGPGVVDTTGAAVAPLGT